VTSLAPILALFLGALLLVGCPGETPDDDSAAADDDDDATTFEPGCITVNGEQPGFAHLQDAIHTASSGDMIELCEGTFAGAVVVDRPVVILGQGTGDTTLTGAVNEMTVTIADTSDVTLSGLTIDSTRNAVVVQTSTGVLLQDLLLESSGQTAISAEHSQLWISEVEFRDHPYAAVDAQTSTLEISDCTFTDLTGYGVRLRASDAAIHTSEFDSVVTQPTSDDYDGTCIFADDSTLTVYDSAISTCTRVGIYGVDSDLDVAGSTVAECANGIVGIAGVASSVTGCAFEEVPLFGILLVDQAATITGNTLHATDPGDGTCGVAVGADDGAFEISDNDISGYGQIGIWVQYPFWGDTPTGGSAVLSGNTVTDVALHGVLLTELDEAEVTGNVISGITWGGEAIDGGYTDGFGLNLWTIGELTLSENEVTDVDVVGIYVLDSEFVATDDEVHDTGVWGILISGSSGTFEGLLVNNTAIYGLDVRTSDVDFVNALIRNGHQGIPPEYWEDGWPLYYYAHAAMFSDSQCSFTDSWFLDNDDWALELYDTDVRVEGTTFRGDSQYGIYSAYGFGEIRDNSFEDMTYAIFLDCADEASQIGDLTVADNLFTDVYSALYSSNLAATTTFEGNQLDATTGYGLYLADTVTDGAVVEVRDNSFAAVAASAVYASGIELQMEGANTIDGVDNGYAAVDLDTVTGTVSGLAVANSTGPGLSAVNSDLTITGCELVGSAGHNLQLRDSTILVLDNPALSQGSAAGVKLEGVVQGSITGNTIQDNAAHGIYCDSADVVLDACDNTMGGNAPADLFEEGGCALACTVR
jgi:nitrous oxidase accessory protein NosD